MSGYCGPDIDFGNGPRLFLNNFKRNEVILIFKDYFEDPSILKCWYEYSKCKHTLYNHGIDFKGFAGDISHMARLEDPTRSNISYTLPKLSHYYRKEISNTKGRIINTLLSNPSLTQDQKSYITKHARTTTPSLKFSTPISSTDTIIIEPHSTTHHATQHHSIDTTATHADDIFYIREMMARRLMAVDADGLNDMLDVYTRYWLPCGELMADIEKTGFGVRVEDLAHARNKVEDDLVVLCARINELIRKICPQADGLNISSTQQLQHFFYAPFTKSKYESQDMATILDEHEESIPIDNAELDIDQGDSIDQPLITSISSEQLSTGQGDKPGLIREFKVKNTFVRIVYLELH